MTQTNKPANQEAQETVVVTVSVSRPGKPVTTHRIEAQVGPDEAYLLPAIPLRGGPAVDWPVRPSTTCPRCGGPALMSLMSNDCVVCGNRQCLPTQFLKLAGLSPGGFIGQPENEVGAT